MKIVLIVLAALVLVMVAIVIVGALLPKHHHATRTAIIKAPPEQVFQLISGPQDWRTDLKEHKFYDEGGHRMVREIDKHGQTITYQVVELHSPAMLKRVIADKKLPFGGSWTWNIEPRPGGCQVTIAEDGEVYNPVFRFVSRFILGHRRTLDHYLVMLSEAAQPAQ